MSCLQADGSLKILELLNILICYVYHFFRYTPYDEAQACDKQNGLVEAFFVIPWVHTHMVRIQT